MMNETAISNSPTSPLPLPRQPPHAISSRRDRFFAGYFWFIGRNLIGWVLILLAFVAGPLVPGPGGLPLFLIGFALISFPGKRRLTARVLRGRTIRFPSRWLMLAFVGVSLLAPALALWLPARYPPLGAIYPHGPLAAAGAYLGGVVLTWLLLCGALFSLNLLLRVMPPLRRHIRPWLRHHHIRLLPPRRRKRLHHEPGVGALRLKDEILSFARRPHHRTGESEHR